MLNGRLYRAAFVPLLFALAIVGFSLGARARPLGASLAPDAFDGARAFVELRSLAARFPQRRPGSQGDQALAASVAQTLRGFGGISAGGFSVTTRRFQAQTIDGRRTLTTVIARRPGVTGGRPIVLLAHRDAAGRGALAELSGTAVLLELARVLATSETQRTVVVVSTTGGTGGDAGALDFARRPGGPLDAAIVLGDLAGARAHKPFVVTSSEALGGAPGQLQRTVAAAIVREVGVDPGGPTTLAQLAHLALPLAVGEQGPLLAQGIPAVLVQVSGEPEPSAGEPVSQERLQNFGRAVLSAVYALDANPDIPGGSGGLETGVPVQRKVLPAWALRLLVLVLLLPPLLVLVDGLARLRRRRLQVGPRLLWVLACSLPFLLTALFTRLLGLSGILAAPPGPVPPAALPGGPVMPETVLAPTLVLVLAWLALPALARRLERPSAAARPALDPAAALLLLIVLLAATLVVWVFNPFTALLLLPALHLWLLLASPTWRHGGGRSHRVRMLAVVLLGLAPLILLVAFYAHQLAFDLAQLAQGAVLLLAGGHFGPFAILLSCLVSGCLAAALLVALAPVSRPPGASIPGMGREFEPDIPITVRGPMSYAGPGSLGGTESALRR